MEFQPQPYSRFACPYPDCTERFGSVGDKKRHLRSDHPGDSPCASRCKPSDGDVCGGPRCT